MILVILGRGGGGRSYRDTAKGTPERVSRSGP